MIGELRRRIAWISRGDGYTMLPEELTFMLVRPTEREERCLEMGDKGV